MEQKENKKPATKTSKDLLNLENKSPYPDSFLIKKVTKPDENDSPQKTFAVPKSSVLEAAKAFLPKIAKANESIAEMTPDEFNIENAESDDEHVEMNLALFEYETSEASSEGEDNDEVYDLGELNENNFQIQKCNKKLKHPVIEVLDSSQSDNNS